MSPFLQLALTLAIILLAAKLGGYLSMRLGHPSVLGELLVGVLLGPSLLDLVHLPFVTNPNLGETIHELAELGVLLLMFIAGLGMHISELTKNTKPAALSGTLGVVIPVALGYLAGMLYGLSSMNAIFFGLTIGATSVSISAQTLMELGKLRTKVGLTMLGAAVIDDIIIILMLSITVAIAEGGTPVEILWVILKMILFLLASIWFGLKALPKLSTMASKLPVSQNILTFTLIILLVYGVASEALGGMAAITGTFIAGLMFSRTKEKAYIEPGVRALSYSIFVPIFFVNIGLQINIRELGLGMLAMTLILSLLAIVGKILGSGAGARMTGMTWLESLQLGIGMVSRGEVGLIVASIGLASNHLTQELFSAVVGMVLVTTLVTPILLRWSFKDDTTESPQPLETGG